MSSSSSSPHPNSAAAAVAGSDVAIAVIGAARSTLGSVDTRIILATGTTTPLISYRWPAAYGCL